MRHDQVRENLSAYIDGTLEPALAQAVERHAQECAACAEEIAEMRQVYALLGQPALNVEPPPAFHDNVMRKVRLAQREQARTPRGILARLGWGWTTAGAAAVAVVLLVFALAVGPLHDGLSAGLGLGKRPAPAVILPAGDIHVSFPVEPVEANREAQLIVRPLAPMDGEWRLVARPAPGLSLLSPYAAGPDGAFEVWRGRLAGGQAAATVVGVFPAQPGTVAELSLRLEGTDGRVVAERQAFLPVRAGAQSGAAPDWPRRSNGTLRSALYDYARIYGQPISAPSGALDVPCSPALSGADAGRTVQAIAEQAGLEVRKSGGGYALVK